RRSYVRRIKSSSPRRPGDGPRLAGADRASQARNAHLRRGPRISGARRRRTLPERVADEERAERLDVLRGLDGLPHGLHEVRKGMQVAADETDDEIVIVDVEPVAREADIVGEVGVAVGAARHGGLADDGALLLRRET